MAESWARGRNCEPSFKIQSANDTDSGGGAHDDGGGRGWANHSGSGRGRDTTGAIDAARTNHGIGRSNEGGKAGEGG
jgi:hypothetical protein